MNLNKKSGLGRGLSALLESNDTDITASNKSEAVTVNSIAFVEIAKIETNPFQPRTHFEQQALEELALSIKEHGVIQPITVRKLGYDKYQLISGERRFRATQLAGLDSIPAFVRIANDEAMLEMAIIENIHRQNLNAIEIALSYQRLIDDCNLTHEELSQKMSKQRSTVSNYLRLLKLPADIQIAIRDEKITMGHARALVNIENEMEQLNLFKEIIKQGWSVRQAEENAQKIKSDKKDADKQKSAEPLSFEHERFSKGLNNLLKTSVDLKVNPKGNGKIIINFKSEKELKRIAELFNI